MIINIKESKNKYTNAGIHFEYLEIVNGFDYKPNDNYIAILSGYWAETNQKAKWYIYPNSRAVIAIY